MTLYPYQKRVKELIQAGKSVILQAPTGAGKTRAALSPFIENFFDHADGSTPRKCIYSVPMRVLANQFENEHRQLAEKYQRIYRKNINVTIQTGEHSKDKEFTGDLVFCTIDQFLSSYLNIPYGLPRRLANLNAGAFVGSYLVFDEFHLLDPDSTLPSTLYAVKRLSKIAPVLLMTATFSRSVLNTLKDELHNAEIVLVDPLEAKFIETSFGEKTARQRKWQVAESQLNAKDILEKHKKRSLAICNTVKRAQTLYRELIEPCQNNNIELILLHSRFLQEDRQRNELKIKSIFERGNSKGSVIAITTQTIEVGIDITSDVLHTELAPASALIQRAGRCARYAGEQGQVIVYPVEQYSPYGTNSDDSTWGKEMRSAFLWLQENNGKTLDFGKEQEFIDQVSTPRDEKILLSLSAGAPLRVTAIHNILNGINTANANRLLVRDADSKFVLIHPNPDELTSDPYLAKGFNIPTKTLFGMVKEWLNRDVEVNSGWRVKRLIESKNDEEENNRTDYGWVRLSDAGQLTASQVIVVNPELAGYIQKEGFVPETGNTDFITSMPDSKTKKEFEGFSYRIESYEEHIMRVLETFQDVSLKEILYSAKALEQYAGWSEGSVIRAAWLACLFHDVGKLSTSWQGWARAYQKEIGMPISPEFSAGHTEFDRKNPIHRKAEISVRKYQKRPNHAAEGAMAIAKTIADAFTKNEEGLVKALLTAITRHHTPFTSECGAYVLENQAKSKILTTIDLIPDNIRQWVNLEALRIESRRIQNSFSNLLILPDDDVSWMVYALIVRVLRRSDQAGTARGSR